MSGSVLSEISDGVALFTLHRPERNNAYTVDMELEYHALLEIAGADEAVRVIVLTGSGASFCPGLDIELLRSSVAAGTPLTAATRRPPYYPLTIPKPIIAAVNGACAGIGLILALTADVRFAAAGSRWSTSWARRGLAGEHGMTWLIPRLVGMSRAIELMISGRTFSAEHAHAIGLVHEVVEPDAVLERALAYARDLAVNASPTSMALIKHAAWRHQLTPSLPEAWTDSMRQATAIADRTDDGQEGAASWVERRPPRFAPLPADFDPASFSKGPIHGSWHPVEL